MVTKYHIDLNGTGIKYDRAEDVTPLFLRINPENIQTIEEATPSFMSLLTFVLTGNDLDNKAIWHACTLLKTLTPRYDGPFDPYMLLFQLIPKQDGSCSGFAESVITLLTSSNESLFLWTLSLLFDTMHMAHQPLRFKFLETGFFALLPKSFYQQKIHLSTEHTFFVSIVVDMIKSLSDHSTSRANRRRLTDAYNVSQLLGTLVEYSPNLQQMTHFFLSSSVALTSTDCLHLYEKRHMIDFSYLSLEWGLRFWGQNERASQIRGQQIWTKLSGQGILDEIEHHFRFRGCDDHARTVVSTVAKLIHMLGGNAPKD
ncbi:hypothetical protein BLNAU_21347 [Blattamonas nauphoetae]|uniref:Uncharacterized protein n=1 Tax=Blattamonas nauphoetae TaxID=2049346 RepID=A0ABQ9WW69_9EUKA|nr:hypothetical protein BLNAU_21347 [Blattamonas nauphoetae]